MKNTIIIVVVALAVLIIGYAMWPAGEDPEPEPQAEPAAPAPRQPAPEPAEPTPAEPAEEPEAQASVPEPEPEPEEPLPPLPESDPFVRERMADIELPDDWLEQGDYVRRLTVLAENASRGTYPRSQLQFLDPAEPFKVEERGDRTFIDPASYDRYDRYVDTVTGVDPGEVAGLLQSLQPLVEAALTEVGVNAPPDEVFASALEEVLEVPVLERDVEVVQPHVMYEYADPRLEALSPLQKQMLRMGPDNVRRLQEYLRSVAAEMDLDV
ncbi:MAG: DUF3014 domain-containing protein [Gammaproteobacteria bacterium]|nr:DUF3014 domain-containing protein [Gammaproteobacteria bacterium]